MPAAVWKGSIVLSFVSIPVRLYAAARSERTYLHQLHTVCCIPCATRGCGSRSFAPLAEQLIVTMMQPFKAAQYHDEFQDRLRELVEAKRRGQTVGVEEAAKRAPVIDMVEALKKSLASRSKSEAETKKLPEKHQEVAVKSARPANFIRRATV